MPSRPPEAALLLPGMRLGPHEVLARLGGGGMGEVYRAVDTRLSRTVAIKVLRPDAPGRLDERFRFDREVRAISSTNHPHICALYDIGHERGLDFLVMEYLQGQTLADRLRKGRLPIDQALLYGSQIASALGHVHRHGLVHRDIKPSNVMLTESGAKLLDFGIAKTAGPFGVANRDETGPDEQTLTLAGVLIGTVQYMAPEALEGLGTDPRTDIFALGLVLYEMATGHKAFAATSAAATIAAVLSSDVKAFDLPPFRMAQTFERTVRKCLSKSPDDRWQNVEDLRSELEWIREHVAEPLESQRAATPATKRKAAFGWGIVAVLVTLPAAWAVFPGGARALTPTTSGAEMVRFHSYPPRGNRDIYFGLKSVVSPDGRYLVSATELPDGRKPLWLRRFDSTTGIELDGTDGANYPFWSPDSRSIGFFASGQLKSIELTGGRPQYLGQDPSAGARGASWNRDGAIIVGSDGTGLFLLSTKDGPAVPLTVVDSSAGEIGHTLPQFLPDGRHFLFLIRSIEPARSGIYVASLEAPQQQTRILDISGEARYVQNQLLFSKDRALFAQPFDAVAVRLNGSPVKIADGIAYNTAGGRTGFSVSENGVLAYQADSPKVLAWFDRTGKRISTVATGDIDDPVISPDGTRIALTRLDPQTGKRCIWVSGPSRSFLRRLETKGSWNEVAPVWSPRGDRLLLASDRDGHFQLYSRSAEGGDEELIPGTSGDVWPLDWSSDGRFVLFRGGSSTGELWALPLGGDRRPISLARTDPVLAAGKISPDGRWLAYVSSEVGGGEVFVRAFPSGGAKFQVSSGGGGEPRWRADGRELFYLTRDGTLMSAPIVVGARLKAGPPVPLFSTKVAATVFIGAAARNQYDLGDNGEQFLISEPQEFISSTPMTIVLNWPAVLHEQ